MVIFFCSYFLQLNAVLRSFIKMVQFSVFFQYRQETTQFTQETTQFTQETTQFTRELTQWHEKHTQFTPELT